ncbi:hypothetical protein [Idiomarina sp.]|uniref:hypothetical protein n=1 Tax=Idiomarina sp. TaxID=1874361 RepID=UPI0025B7CF69|nr:hypothetical protein [Idiomarina sp.]
MRATGDEFAFVVPEEAQSGLVRIVPEDGCSNTLWLSVSDIPFVASDPHKPLKDEAMNPMYAGEYVLFQLNNGFSLVAARDVAQQNGTTIIGASKTLNVYQASVSPEQSET